VNDLDLLRAFLALPLPAAAGAEVLERVRSALAAPQAFRYPRPETLHVTLRFLGDVSPDGLDDLAERARAAFAGARTLELGLDGAGAFPARGPLRVLWLGVREAAPGGGRPATGAGEGAGQGPLADLHARAVRAVREALPELPPERAAFRPHVTVARPRRAERRPPGGLPPAVGERFLEATPPLRWRADHAVLYRSVRGPGPSEYRVLADFPFSG